MTVIEPRIPARTEALEGSFVRLEPLARSHLGGLAAAGLGTEVFRWFTVAPADPAGMAAFVEGAVADQAAGTALPFATVDRATGIIAGSTRFGAIDRTHRRAEIGWTWLGPRWQRTALNTEAKLLMLTQAFEAWGCIRVEFKTDIKNHQSQSALERLGARREGVFRNHYICWDGRIRDSVWYSIVDEEWPAVRDRLRARLAGSGQS